MNDHNGNQIQLGDEVILCQRSGAGVAMTQATVVRMTAHMLDLQCLSNPHIVVKCNPHSVIIVPHGSRDYARNRPRQ